MLPGDEYLVSPDKLLSTRIPQEGQDLFFQAIILYIRNGKRILTDSSENKESGKTTGKNVTSVVRKNGVSKIDISIRFRAQPVFSYFLLNFGRTSKYEVYRFLLAQYVTGNLIISATSELSSRTRKLICIDFTTKLVSITSIRV